MRPSRGEPRLLKEDRRDPFAALVSAAVAKDMEEGRGEGVSCRPGGDVAVWMDLGCMGDEDIDLEGGREFRSGGAIEEVSRVHE